jgi:recombination protein RecR
VRSAEAAKLGPAALAGWAASVACWAKAAESAERSNLVYEGAVQDLIDELGRLPGIGPKSAQRLAFHLLAADPHDVRRLVEAINEVKEKVRFCQICGNVAQEEQCRICRDPRRDPTVLCVVEEPKDVVAIERTREFRGRYHILGGAISPIEGIGPDDLRIKELMQRLVDGEVTELILATDPNLEGEATATYLARLLKPMGLRVTRLASGLPVGGDLEYADEVTLGRAFEGRRLLDV